MEEVGEYFDFLVFEKNISNDKIRAMESVLNEVFRKVNEQYDIQLSANFAMVLARMIYSSMRAGDGRIRWTDAIRSFPTAVMNCFPENVRRRWR